jgi:hypothetical protein
MNNSKVASNVAFEGDSWYNEGTKLLCSRDALTPLGTLMHSWKEYIVTTIPHHAFFCPACELSKDPTEQYVSRSQFILCKSCASEGKYCPACTEYKLFPAFAKNKARRDGIDAYCRACKQKHYKDSYTLEKSRSYRLKTRFNLTLFECDKMFTQQGGLCAICHQPETAMDNTGKKIRALAVDHDHKTGAVRQLLCHSCNYLLGYVKDNAELLQSASAYLKKHADVEVEG